MSVYMTEEEQLAVIKNWWRRYSTVITVVLSIFLIAISGYRYWNWHQEKLIAHASNSYEKLMAALSNQNSKAVNSYANQLIKDYPKTVYGDVARMTLAKLYVEKANYQKARLMLEPVAKNSPMSALKEIAHLRIARVLTAQKEYDNALKELSKIATDTYQPMVNELKGDIFAARNNFNEALAYYNKAATAVKILGVTNLYLEMKEQEIIASNENAKQAVVS